MSFLPIYRTLNADAAVKAILGNDLRVYEDLAPLDTPTLMQFGKRWAEVLKIVLIAPLRLIMSCIKLLSTTHSKSELMKLVKQLERLWKHKAIS